MSVIIIDDVRSFSLYSALLRNVCHKVDLKLLKLIDKTERPRLRVLSNLLDRKKKYATKTEDLQDAEHFKIDGTFKSSLNLMTQMIFLNGLLNKDTSLLVFELLPGKTQNLYII